MKSNKILIIIAIVIIIILLLLPKFSSVEKKTVEEPLIERSHPLGSKNEVLYTLFHGENRKIEKDREKLMEDLDLSSDRVDSIKEIALKEHEEIEGLENLSGKDLDEKIYEIKDKYNKELKELFETEEDFEKFKKAIGDWWADFDPDSIETASYKDLFIFPILDDETLALIDDELLPYVSDARLTLDEYFTVNFPEHEMRISELDEGDDKANYQIELTSPEGDTEKVDVALEKKTLEVEDEERDVWGIVKATGEGDYDDVPYDAYYRDPIRWAVENEITSGMEEGEFWPNYNTTRGQIVTFLWRAYGMEEPETTESPFEDIDPEAYYYKPILWASENGIAQGMSDTEFMPDREVTRGEAVTFQWRAAGEEEGATHDFEDVEEGSYYETPIAWASENKIAQGMSDTEFMPDREVTRAQIVTFLYREFGEE